MPVKIRSTSRMIFARLLTLTSTRGEDVETWEMPELPEVAASGDDIIYQVQQDDRIDLIAERFYGNPELWWVIALANDLNLLPNDLAPFSTIRIPSNKRVFTKILSQAPKKREGR